MDLDQICYKNTPIKKVVLRIDFLSKVLEINEALPVQIVDVIKKFFPIAEARNLVAKELQISNQNVTQNEKIVQEWHFHTTERNASLIINEDSLTFDINNYISFQDFFKVFIELKNVFFFHFNNLLTRRIGLRYINELVIDEENPFDWSKYIKSNLTSIFKVSDNEENIIRAFHNLEVKYDDIMLKFQYGVHNPDYPAKVKRKVFILDLDAFYNGMLKQHEIDNYVNKQHEIIQNQFERSITKNLRNHFGIKK